MGESAVEMEALQERAVLRGTAPGGYRRDPAVGQPVSFEPGQAMVEQGDAGDGMYIIVERHR